MSSGAYSRTPLVSVIMPTHNHGTFLADAIDSVRKQTLEDFELIVIDDGSTDRTPEILATITDERVRCFRTANRGKSAARNFGLENARGKYLAFLDSDDLYHPEKLQSQVTVLEMDPKITMCFHDFARFSSERRFEHTHFDFVPELKTLPASPLVDVADSYVLEGDAFQLLTPLPLLPIWLQTLMLRRKLVQEFRFDEELVISEDLAYVLRCYQGGRAAYIDRCLVNLRRHDGNSFSDPFETILPNIEALRIIQSEIEDLRYKAIIRRRLGDAWRSYGYQGWVHGDRRKAVKGYSRSLSFPGRKINSLAHLGLALLCPFPSLFARSSSRSEQYDDPGA